MLDLAVRCRLRGQDDVGVVLSGGIDSSSLAVTARHHGPVRSYSAVSDHDDTTESDVHPGDRRDAVGSTRPTSIRHGCTSCAATSRASSAVPRASSATVRWSMRCSRRPDRVAVDRWCPGCSATRWWRSRRARRCACSLPIAAAPSVCPVGGIAREPGHPGRTARASPIGDLGRARTQPRWERSAVGPPRPPGATTGCDSRSETACSVLGGRGASPG